MLSKIKILYRVQLILENIENWRLSLTEDDLLPWATFLMEQTIPLVINTGVFNVVALREARTFWEKYWDCPDPNLWELESDCSKFWERVQKGLQY